MWISKMLKLTNIGFNSQVVTLPHSIRFEYLLTNIGFNSQVVTQIGQDLSAGD